MRPRSFWSAPRIATSGLVQRHSGFEWICTHNRLRPEPIRFVRLESEHAQSDGKSVNRGLSVLDFPRSRISCCWPKGARPLRTRMQALTRSFKWLFIINLIIPTRSHLYSLILRSFESTKKIEVIINWSNRTPLFKFKFKFYCTLFTENIHKYIKHMRIKKKGGIWHASVKRD